ncbi:MAG TPA: hypothetical protein VLG16_03575 [Candidatus Saccharimonadales bacterium]|nr:hypothetical protein [Candidatus Saccharimonadales bacterium]
MTKGLVSEQKNAGYHEDKRIYGIATVIILAAVLLLPSRLTSFGYFGGTHNYLTPLTSFAIPALFFIVAVILRMHWVKAAIAAVILCFMNGAILSVGTLAALDCGGDVTATVSLSQACSLGVDLFFKLCLAGTVLSAVFLLYVLPKKAG